MHINQVALPSFCLRWMHKSVAKLDECTTAWGYVIKHVQEVTYFNMVVDFRDWVIGFFQPMRFTNLNPCFWWIWLVTSLGNQPFIYSSTWFVPFILVWFIQVPRKSIQYETSLIWKMQLSNSAATHMFCRKAPTSLFGWRSVSVEAVAGKRTKHGFASPSSIDNTVIEVTAMWS